MSNTVKTNDATSYIFIDTLNKSAVTFVLNGGRSYWEAISPYGEIRKFAAYKAANEWRMREVRYCL